jgi:Ca2+-transporting ATPase
MVAYARGLARYGPGPQASTMAFHSLTAAQLFHALSCRSNRYRALGGALGRQNSLLAASVFGSVGATALLALFPPLRRLLGTAPLAPVDWLVTAAGAVIPFIIIEAAKPWLLKIGGDDDALTDPSERAADSEGEEP